VAIHSGVAPAAGEPIVTKRRFGAMWGTDLPVLLSGAGAKHVVMFGVSTSGAVLSTMRLAADMDYPVSILSDLCHDVDETVHDVLLNKVFPRTATVATSADFLSFFAAKKAPAAAAPTN